MNPNSQKSPNAENEEKLLQFWRDNNIFEKTLTKESPKGEFNFFEGPPTANGRPGIHHVAARSFKDIIPRYKTMQGFSVRRKAGWDTHGLPVELQVEKALGLKSKKEIEAYGVAEFNKKCKESVWTYKEDWEKLTEHMGFWLDMKDPYVTYDNSYIEAIWSIVKRADERGHLYKDFRVGPWCTRCQTTLATHELNQPGAYKDDKAVTIYVRFYLEDFHELDHPVYALAWTTTPWTIPANVALAFNPKIKYVLVKAKHSKKENDIGYYIVTESLVEKIFGENLIEIKPLPFNLKDQKYRRCIKWYDPSHVDETVKTLDDFEEKWQEDRDDNVFDYKGTFVEGDFVTDTEGTGIVHIAPMFGSDDLDIARKNNLPRIKHVSENGKIENPTGDIPRFQQEYQALSEEFMIFVLKELGDSIYKKESIRHQYPHCWRCDTPLIYYARTSWYFAMSKLREQLLAANEQINWEPDHIKEGRFGEWLDGIKDWAISRDRYWGTPLPVWSTESGKKVVIGGIADLKKYAKKAGNKYFVMRHGQAQSNTKNGHESVWDAGGDKQNHLTDTGKQQVESAGKDFSEKLDIIVHSPVLRAVETANEFAKTIGFSGTMIVDERLREVNVGAKYQGQPIFDYFKTKEHYRERYIEVNPDGENYNDVKRRAMEVFYEYEQKYQGQNILFVSHGGVIMNMIIGSRGLAPDEIKDNIEDVEYPKNAEIRELDFAPLPHNEHYELDFHKPYIDNIELQLDGEKLSRTPEVMDVWFDSGSMPIAQDHKLGGEINFNPKPADYIAEGVDQTRGWFYTMHAIANMLHDEPTAAYKNVICMGLLMDEKGQKMSKSKGNIVEPWEMFDKYGADVVRFWFYSVNAPGESKNFDEKGLDEVNKKVFNLLRNVVSFYEMYADQETRNKNQDTNQNPYDSINVLDQWILALWNQTLKTVIDGLEKYQPLEPARAIREFIGELSQWYIRRSRDRFKANDSSAIATTKYILIELSKVMAPFTPFIAEEIFQKVKTSENAESVHLEEFPDVSAVNAEVLQNMEQLRTVVTQGLEIRAKENIKVRQPLSLLQVKHLDMGPEYHQIILDELNVKKIEVDSALEKDIYLDVTITPELRDEGDMRDLIRKIQDMRKTANFEPRDRVMVTLSENEPEWFAKHQAEVLQSVGAQEVVWGGEEGVQKI